VNQIVQEAIKFWNVPGAAVVVVKDDKVIHEQGYGVRALGGRDLVTPDTLFGFISCTKAVTTTAMAMLVDEGKMDWDDPVRKHIEFFRLSDPLADRDVTLRDLVCHRTGLREHFLLEYAAPWGTEETLRRIGRVQLTHSFRSTFDYANVPFIAAGYAVGLAAKSSYQEFVRERIFRPLEMKTANFSVDAMAKMEYAAPHGKNKDTKIEKLPLIKIDNAAGAGCVNLSVRDLGPWMRLHLGAGRFDGMQFVSEKNLHETHTPQMVIRREPVVWAWPSVPDPVQFSYGLGWWIYDHRGHRIVSHAGGACGFRAIVILAPKAKVGVGILSNLYGWPHLPEAVGAIILDLLLDLSKKDWNTTFATRWEKLEAEEKAPLLERQKARRQGTDPSRELAAFAGDYTEPAYAPPDQPARVTVEKDALVLHWSSFHIRLEHYHYDTFTATERHQGEYPIDQEEVVFSLGGDGEVETMKFLGQVFRRVKKKKS
jgi:CubicO group peptidase (beta-lactamase class C family)